MCYLWKHTAHFNKNRSFSRRRVWSSPCQSRRRATAKFPAKPNTSWLDGWLSLRKLSHCGHCQKRDAMSDAVCYSACGMIPNFVSFNDEFLLVCVAFHPCLPPPAHSGPPLVVCEARLSWQRCAPACWCTNTPRVWKPTHTTQTIPREWKCSILNARTLWALLMALLFVRLAQIWELPGWFAGLKVIMV